MYSWGLVLICLALNINSSEAANVSVKKFQNSNVSSCTFHKGNHKYQNLICDTYAHDKRNKDMKVSIHNHSFGASCPCVYDVNNRCRQSPHMCTASSSTSYCLIQIQRTLITGAGGLVDCKTSKIYTFQDPTMSGMAPIYFAGIHEQFSSRYTQAGVDFMNQVAQHTVHETYLEMTYPHHKYVVPMRMRWDDCFNHLSFQSLPMIGLVYEFLTRSSSQHRKQFGASFHPDKLVFHASRYTGAMLQLIGVPPERIVVERPIIADRIILPWVKVSRCCTQSSWLLLHSLYVYVASHRSLLFFSALYFFLKYTDCYNGF